MTRSTADRIVDDYLAELDDELAGAPAARRRALHGELRAHIAQARAELPGGGTEAEVRSLLDRLGEPSEIAADAYDGVPAEPAPPPRAGWMEGLALVLLPIGGVVIPFVGWLAGVALLWASSRWTAREKWIGTLVVPFGLMPAVMMFFIAGVQGESCVSSWSDGGSVHTHCTGGPSTATSVLWVAVFAVLLLALVASTIFLGRRLGAPRRRAGAAPATARLAG